MTALKNPGANFDIAGRGIVRLRCPFQMSISRRAFTYQLMMVALIMVLSVWALIQGDYRLSAGQVIQALLGEGDRLAVYFVGQVRLPRILAAVVVGGALGLAGAIFQIISGNSLGSPDIIGFTHGAANGALVSIILFNSGPLGISTGAVIGGLTTSLLVWVLTRHTGLRGFRLILIGLGVGATFSALNSLLVVRASLSQSQTAASWLAGSLNTMNWDKLFFFGICFLTILPFLFLLARPLGSLKYGDQISMGIGISVNRIRIIALFVGVLLVSLATATTGPLAFVALAAPHISQSITKPSGAGLGSATVTGAVLVLLSDLIGQYAFAVPLQVGVVTGAFGGLYLILLLVKERKKKS